jgi:hypothetical protein
MVHSNSRVVDEFTIQRTHEILFIDYRIHRIGFRRLFTSIDTHGLDLMDFWRNYRRMDRDHQFDPDSIDMSTTF